MHIIGQKSSSTQDYVIQMFVDTIKVKLALEMSLQIFLGPRSFVVICTLYCDPCRFLMVLVVFSRGYCRVVLLV